MKIKRTTHVISVSLSKKTVNNMEQTRKFSAQSRSSFVASLIDKATEESRWDRIYKNGAKTARDFKVTSEEDIDKILHEA